MQEVTQMVHLFLELMTMLKNKLLPTIPILIFQWLISLFQKVFYLILLQKKIKEATGVGNKRFKDLYPS